VTGSDPAETTAATFCATLVDEWVRGGMTDAVVAPGSRSTPMALALVADGRLRIHVHHDERDAGFVALGLGLATGRPAVVICTSGTAAVELHPAVVEAHQAKVPLLVCTADRPPELHDVGAPQTIDQQQLYGRAVRLFLDPGVADEGRRGSWRSLAAQVQVAAQTSPPGPVHLNLRFRDPLVGRPGDLPEGRPQGAPWHRRVIGGAPSPTALEALAAGMAERRGVIVAGGGIGEPDGVHGLAESMGWPVLADPRSGCRTPRSRTISHFDSFLREPALAARLRPEVVLRLGSLPASKVLGQWLAGLDAWQVAIDADGTRYDPDRQLDALLTGSPGETCAHLAELVARVRLEAAPMSGRDARGDDAPEDEAAETGPDDGPVEGDDGSPSWAEHWAHADAEAAEAIVAVLSGHPEPTEPAVARDLLRALPEGATLVVSSSMPVRDLEWFASPRTGVRVVANRGANGIDGVVSTAVGVALASRSSGPSTSSSSPGSSRGADPVALLIGDVALLHDTNGLLGAARRGIDLTVVVIDNDGGGIFSFLPQADALDAPAFEQLFGTPHGVDLLGLAAAHGIGGRRLARQSELSGAVAESVSLGGVHLIVVPTDRAANVALHAEINAAVAAAVSPRSRPGP
jgi:2-succinyl-5-enolpyruvyl-6-hydroxy-3-cyclohexene-1-carboxylate synthase